MIDFECNRFAFLFQLLEADYQSDYDFLKDIEELPSSVDNGNFLIETLKKMYTPTKSDEDILNNPYFRLTLMALNLFENRNDIQKKDEYVFILFNILSSYSRSFKSRIEEKIHTEKKDFLIESIDSAKIRLAQVFGRELSEKESGDLEKLIIETLVGGELYNDTTFQTFVVLCGLETSTYLMKRAGAELFTGISTEEIIELTREISRTFRTIYSYAGREEFPGVELGAFESLYPYFAALENENINEADLNKLFEKSQLDTSAGKDPSFNLLAYFVSSQDTKIKRKALNIALDLLNPKRYDMNLNAMEGLSIIPGAREAITYILAKESDLSDILPGLKNLLVELEATGKILYYDEGFPIVIAAGLNERKSLQKSSDLEEYVSFLLEHPSIPGGNISGLLIARNYDYADAEKKFMEKLNPAEQAFLHEKLESGQFKEYMEDIWSNTADFGNTSSKFYDLLQNSFEYIQSDNFKNECRPRCLLLKQDDSSVELMFNRTPFRAFVFALSKAKLTNQEKLKFLEKVLHNNPYEFYLYANIMSLSSKKDSKHLIDLGMRGENALNKLLKDVPKGKIIRLPGAFTGNLSILEMLASYGIILQELHRPKEAIRLYEMILDFDPADILETRGRLANIFMELKKYNELEKLLNVYPDDELLEIIANRTYLDLFYGRKENAETGIMQVMNSNPHVIDALLGTIDYMNGEKDHKRKELAIAYAAKNVKYWAANPDNFNWLKKMKELYNEMFDL